MSVLETKSAPNSIRRDKHNWRLIIIAFDFRIWVSINFNENIEYMHPGIGFNLPADRLQQPQSCHLALDNNFVSINYNYPVGA